MKGLDGKRLLHFHFIESDVPYGECMTEEMLVLVNETEGCPSWRVHERISDAVEKAKWAMDDPDLSEMEIDTYGEDLYEKYSDFGWHEKLHKAMEFVLAMPCFREYGGQVLTEREDYNTRYVYVN